MCDACTPPGLSTFCDPRHPNALAIAIESAPYPAMLTLLAFFSLDSRLILQVQPLWAIVPASNFPAGPNAYDHLCWGRHFWKQARSCFERRRQAAKPGN